MRWIAALGAMCVLAGSPVAAQDWSAQVTPYVWATGLGGSVTPFTHAPTVRFHKSFSDVLKDLDGAFFLSGYARYDRIVAMGDLSWSSSSRAGVIYGAIPAEAKLMQRSVTLAGGYRVVESADMSVDALAGMRAWWVRSSVSVADGAYFSISPRDRFVDPIVAVRTNMHLSPQVSAIFYADAGGFSMGSEHTYQLLATVNYQVNEEVFVSGGYRALYVDYINGGTQVDAVMAGPLLGVTWKF